MSGDLKFDADNPEWTKQDLAQARPAGEVLTPEVLTSFGKGKVGRPVGYRKAAAKTSVTLRLDPDVVERWRASGPGWQTRMNEALRKALPAG